MKELTGQEGLLDTETRNRVASQQKLALGHLESALVLYRNCRYEDAASLLRKALLEGCEALDLLVPDENVEAEGQQPEEPLEPAAAVARAEMMDLVGRVEGLEQEFLQDAGGAGGSGKTLRKLLREGARLLDGADKSLRRRRRPVGNRKVARSWLSSTSRRAVIVILGALLFALVGSYALRVFRTPRSGLRAEYYAGMGFERLVTERFDNMIAFKWLDGASPPKLEPRHFSVRWTGNLLAEEGGKYTFLVKSDDGARLWIDDALVIDAWVEQGVTGNSSSIELSPGWHALRLEYFQNVGGAVCELYWQQPGMESPGLVPPERLRPGSGTAVKVVE